MIKKISALLFFTFLIACSATRNSATSGLPGTRVKLTTDSGVIILRLYDKTPLHRDNFIKLVKQHYFDSLLFHRVIKNFMIQGGDPDSKNAKPAILLGNGGPSYTIPAEFYKTIGGAPHLDMNYTVFGEVESGLEVVDKIASASRDSNNRPLTDIRMKMKILRKK